MARPIESTPVLRGKDAANLINALANPRPRIQPEVDMEKLRRHVAKALENRAKKR
jgi:hypothetical protein